MATTAALLRWGIVSAGKISEDFVIALSTLPASEHNVVAVATRHDENRAANFARKHGIPNAYGSYLELAKCQDIDIAYVGALNPQHFEIAELMLKHGKHVLCEKPLCMNKQQVEKLIATARTSRRFLMEAVWSRFLPAYQYLREQINAGALGVVKEVQVDFGFALEQVDRLTSKDQGGGVVYDLGIYTIQLSQWVFKDAPQSIVSVGELKAGVDIDVKATLSYSGERKAVMHVSGKSKLENVAIIKGSKGQIELPNFWTPNSLIDIDGTVKEWKPPKGNLPTNYVNSECLRYEAEAARQSVLAGALENDIVSHNDSLLFADIEDNIRKQIGALNEYDDQ